MLAAIYPWVKALHVISVIVWMGGQIALFLILAMHKNLSFGSEQAVMLVDVESKLVRRMLNPGVVAAFICGGTMLAMIFKMGGSLSAWLIVKLVLAILLSAMHGLLLRECRFVAAASSRSGLLAGGIAQWINLALLVAVVMLVIIKPALHSGIGP